MVLAALALGDNTFEMPKSPNLRMPPPQQKMLLPFKSL